MKTSLLSRMALCGLLAFTTLGGTIVTSHAQVEREMRTDPQLRRMMQERAEQRNGREVLERARDRQQAERNRDRDRGRDILIRERERQQAEARRDRNRDRDRDRGEWRRDRDRNDWRRDRYRDRSYYRDPYYRSGPTIIYEQRPVYVEPRYVAPRYVAPAPRYDLSSAHVRWCENRYRSYRAYDNTFQPYNGPRQQCYSPYS